MPRWDTHKGKSPLHNKPERRLPVTNRPLGIQPQTEVPTWISVLHRPDYTTMTRIGGKVRVGEIENALMDPGKEWTWVAAL